MKIGVVTPYDSANYGAYLQAYATKKYLESLGHCVYMVKWRSEEDRKKVFFKKAKTIKEALKNLQRRKQRKNNYKLMTDALTEFNIIDKSRLKEEGIDLLVLGSDEIWNVDVPAFQKEIFYGGAVGEIKSLAYAPSAGNASADKFKGSSYSDLMKKIKIVGVRDENTAEIAKAITGEKPNIVCDPTLLLTVEDYLCKESVNCLNDDYMLVYSYSIPKSLQALIKQYARENHLKLVSVCMYHSWCDINICCKPLEFVQLIYNAKCVFTTTFHGTIFTLLNHKNCAVYAGSKKLKDLLSWTRMDSVSVTADISYQDFSRMISSNPDYKLCEDMIDERRNKSRSLYKEELSKYYE